MRTAMPLDYTIDRRQRVITIIGEYADGAEWQDVLERIHSDPLHEPGDAFLRDLRTATTPVDAMTVVGVIEVVRLFWPRLQPSRIAVLTPLSVDPAALVAHALADAEGMPLQTFTSHEAALEWLAEGFSGTI